MQILQAEHSLVKPDKMPYSVVEMRRMYGCDQALIATQPHKEHRANVRAGTDVASAMAQVTRDSGFELKSIKLIRFKVGEGLTLAQLLAESMADMHTYPEHDGCVHLWLDYCSWQRDNADKAVKWWEGNTKLLKPKRVIKYPPIYVPVEAAA